MPDIEDRSERESRLADAIVLLFRRYSAVGSIDWVTLKSDLVDILGPELASTFEASFNQIMAKYESGQEDDPERLAAWVNQYSNQLADLIVENTRKGLEAGKDVFTDDRANRIAITETTRAVTAGENGALLSLLGLGLLEDFEAIWHTADDDAVCPICEPLHEQGQDVWGPVAPAGPPAHVNCRCWLEYSQSAAESEKIKIKPSPTADTRSSDFEKVTKEELIKSSKMHIKDVQRALDLFRDLLSDAGKRHDHDKIDRIDWFFEEFHIGFKTKEWLKNHYKENRHHLSQSAGTPDDVNLIDVLEFIADCVVAGSARSGVVYELDLPLDLLRMAFDNTVRLLKSHIEIEN